MLEGQVVVYDNVIVNKGGAYDSNSGIFTAPIEGYYHLEVHAFSNDVGFNLAILVNGKRSFTLTAWGSSAGVGTSNGGIVHLLQNDKVKVAPFTISRIYGNRNFFSGYLIKQPDILFTTSISESKTVLEGQVLVYDNTTVNKGVAYNTNTGIFTCPLNGYYHFEVHAFAKEVDFNLELLVNGKTTFTITTWGPKHERGTSSGGIVKLNKNDQVKVASIGSTSRLYKNRNVFSGYIIKHTRGQPVILFTASISSSRLRNSMLKVPRGHVVVYDYATVNEGGAYDSTTGIFTCPLDGYYHFEVHAFGYHRWSLFWLSLEVNGRRVFPIFTSSFYARGTSGGGVVKLNKHDQVRVTSLGSDLYKNRNNFSGQLISLIKS